MFNTTFSFTFLIFFFFFFLVATISLTSVFLSVNTVYSTFSLIVVFFTTSLVLFMLDYEFVAIIYTTIYVGAISIFFIFILMTINIRFEDSSEYKDEIYFDKNFSFFVLLGFSFLIQNMFFVEFKNLVHFKDLVEHYNFMDVKSLLHKYDILYMKRFDIDDNVFIDFDRFRSKLADVFFSESFISHNITACNKLDLYSDLNLIAFNLYGDMQVLFLLITYILLFSMLGSIGFAMRSR